MTTATLSKPAAKSEAAISIKTYAAKSSVIRAAIKMHAGIKKEDIKVAQNSEGYFWANATALLFPKAAQTGVKARKFSTVVSPCKLVWDIAEKMAGSKRKDIIAACQEAGVAFYTARTQYQKYTEALRGDGTK